MKIRMLSVAAFALGLLLASQAHPFKEMAAAKKVEGTVKIKVQKHDPEGKIVPLSGIKVSLTTVRMSLTGEASEDKVKAVTVTDKKGIAVFKGIKASHGSFFIGGIAVSGRDYLSEPVSFTDKNIAEGTLDIYDPTDDDSAIKIMKNHLIVDKAEGGKMTFTELLIITNGSELAYFPPKGGGLRINLPKGASNARFEAMSSPDSIKYVEGEDHFIYFTPVQPGRKGAVSVGMTYDVDFKGSSYNYETKNSYPVEAGVLLVSDPDLRVKGKSLVSAGTKEFNGKSFAIFEFSDLKKGDLFSFKLYKDGLKWETGKVAIVAGLVVLAVFALFASFRWRKRDENP